MASELKTRFLTIERELLTSIDNEGSLDQFSDRWSHLYADLAQAIETGSVDEELLQLAADICATVESASQFTLLINTEADTSFDILLDNLERLSLTPISHTESHTPHSPSTEPSSSAHGVPLIGAAYEWLLANIHNPYPSPTVLASLQQTSRCDVKSLEQWFRSARRYVGWLSIIQNHFNGHRRHALDAAYRCLVQGDTGNDDPLALTLAFIEVETKVLGMFKGVSGAPTEAECHRIWSESVHRAKNKRSSTSTIKAPKYSQPSKRKRDEDDVTCSNKRARHLNLQAPATGTGSMSIPGSRKRRLSESEFKDSTWSKRPFGQGRTCPYPVSDPLPTIACSLSSSGTQATALQHELFQIIWDAEVEIRAAEAPQTTSSDDEASSVASSSAPSSPALPDFDDLPPLFQEYEKNLCGMPQLRTLETDDCLINTSELFPNAFELPTYPTLQEYSTSKSPYNCRPLNIFGGTESTLPSPNASMPLLGFSPASSSESLLLSPSSSTSSVSEAEVEDKLQAMLRQKHRLEEEIEKLSRGRIVDLSLAI